MGNKSKDKIVESLFKVIRKNPQISVSDLAIKADVHSRTVESWLPLIVKIQGEPTLKEIKTSGSILYSMEE